MKNTFIIFLLSVIVFGCNKHNHDYQKNIPKWHPSIPEEPEETEYTLEDLNKMATGNSLDYRNVDRFIQGYMTATNIDIKGELSFDKKYYYICLSLDGPIVKGGAYRNDPCDKGFNELADSYGDTYGPYDAVEYRYISNPIIVHTNNIKYEIYVINNFYDESHPDGSILNDITTYFYGQRDYKRPLIGKRTETAIKHGPHNLDEYNKKNNTMIVVGVENSNNLRIPLPAQVGTYSFRVVAKNGNDTLCDKSIENVQLPARE